MTLRPPLTPGLALALGGLLAGADPAKAAWDNVFQVACDNCGGRRSASYYAPAPAVSYYAPPVVAYSAPACPTPCPPQPQAVVSYVQRSYYQPVTEYQRQSYYEPVKQNYTSYYYEPVTSYKYTTYYDPCTGCPQKVCTPVTSYSMRSKCNSVTSYVERTALVPVTTLKPVTVRQPVVSYYYPPEPVCPTCPPAASAALLPATAPTVDQIRQTPPAVLPPAADGGSNIPPQTIPTAPGGVAYPRTAPPAAQPNVRLRPERTASFGGGVSTVRGEVVLNDGTTPRPGTKLVFVRADDLSKREYASANAFGEFDARLAAGTYFVYVGGENGRATYHKQVTIGDRDTYDYRLVSR